MTRILLFLLAASLATACSRQDNQPALPVTNEAFVKHYFEQFNKHNWPKLAAMYADTAEFKDPSLGSGIVKQTRQQTIDKYTELSRVFPDLHDRVVNTYPAGDEHIVVEFESSGTGPDKVKFNLPICTILTIQNGLITKDFTYFDNFDESN